MFLQDYYQLYTHKCRKPKPQKVVNNVCQYFVLFISSLTSNIIFPTLFKDISPLSSFLHSQDLFTINVCYLNYYFSSSVGIVSAMFSYLVSSIMLLYNQADRYEIPIKKHFCSPTSGYLWCWPWSDCCWWGCSWSPTTSPTPGPWWSSSTGTGPSPSPSLSLDSSGASSLTTSEAPYWKLPRVKQTDRHLAWKLF